jgi:hypothetical protein
MEQHMTDKQYNSNLETIARLIEAKALTPQESAKIVRDAKVPIK